MHVHVGRRSRRRSGGGGGVKGDDTSRNIHTLYTKLPGTVCSFSY
jgi:hypothetical protein